MDIIMEQFKRHVDDLIKADLTIDGHSLQLRGHSPVLAKIMIIEQAIRLAGLAGNDLVQRMFDVAIEAYISEEFRGKFRGDDAPHWRMFTGMLVDVARESGADIDIVYTSAYLDFIAPQPCDTHPSTEFRPGGGSGMG